jgi:arylsulfatase A-like enzyme
LVPYVYNGSSKDKREELMIEHLWDFQPIPPSEGIRTEQWKYFRYRTIKATEELYDLENDPNELNNLASNTKYKIILQNMRDKLDQKITLYSK